MVMYTFLKPRTYTQYLVASHLCHIYINNAFKNTMPNDGVKNT